MECNPRPRNRSRVRYLVREVYTACSQQRYGTSQRPIAEPGLAAHEGGTSEARALPALAQR